MGDGFGLTGQHAGQLPFAAHRLAGRTAVLDFLPMLLLDHGHRAALDVELVWNQLQDLIGTRLNALAASIALVSFNYDEVVA